jgi:hypothetical protein
MGETSASTPSPFVLAVLEHFRADAVISLERAFPPTHALVRGVYVCAGATRCVVEIELIAEPPPPSPVRFLGSFEQSARSQALLEDDHTLPWFVFEAALSVELNLERLVAHARDSVALFGPKASAPACAQEVELSAGGPSDDRTAAIRQQVARRPQPPPPEPPPPPGLFDAAMAKSPSTSSHPEPPPSRPRPSDQPRRSEPPPPKRARGSKQSAPPLPPAPPLPKPISSPPRRSSPDIATHPVRPGHRSSVPAPPEPPAPEPLAGNRSSYRPPAPEPPESMPTAIHARRHERRSERPPPPEPPPPPPLKRE